MLGLDQATSQDVPTILIGAALFLEMFGARYRHRTEDRLSSCEIYAPGVIGLLLVVGAVAVLVR